ncbi:hypothetical protein [Planococcus lenghuensis]|uniref:Uncharacterized protein n=1 Tax=Planococcus lenghuensis TaxID=2213202 RepID=A0A1Q2L2T2_9BACL|nr:hypothetical protein [Planococcus lenghuensis]AQQ54750.1 hypothetical protein B0X71_17675 [Planococcus lenghuensis]
MNNSNIIDFYTRKNYNELTYSDSARYDELIESHGIYFGMLCHQDGEQMRRLIEELSVLSERIKQQHQRQLEVWDQYMDMLGHCLDYLGSPCRKEHYEPLDFDKDSFFVDENNNMCLLKEKYNHLQREEEE